VYTVIQLIDFILFFRCNKNGWRAESYTNCLETKLFSGLPTNVHHTIQLSFFLFEEKLGIS